MYAKHLWKKQNDLDEAISVLKDGLHNHETEEEVYLALVKLYKQKSNFDEARELLLKGREKCEEQRIWMQSVQIEREVGDILSADKILTSAIEKFPKFMKLYLISATLKYDSVDHDGARAVYETAVKECRANTILWKNYATMEINLGNYTKARTLLQKGRIKLPKNDILWYETICLEVRADNLKVATNLCSKALQQCPKSGKLWSLAIELEPVQNRKAKAVQAIKELDQDPHVCISLAKLFWKEKKYDKTQRWLQRATGLDKDLGDAWAYLYKFELENGDQESQNKTLTE